MKGAIGDWGEKIQGQEAIRKAMGGFDIENFGVSRSGNAYSNEAFKGTGNACSLLICALGIAQCIFG